MVSPSRTTCCSTDRSKRQPLRLLDEGLTNAELAERLYVSLKTVDHHVSAVLAKLQAGNRRDAVRRARAAGILN
jgi:DNA-binding NarL/FixJ family response regulator